MKEVIGSTVYDIESTAPKRPRVGAVIVFKKDVDPDRAQELINMMSLRLIEKTEVVEYDAAIGSPVWYIP